MRMIAGLDRPTTGRVMVDGKDVTGVPVRPRSVAMVYQQFINYPSLTVYENIASPLRVAGGARPRLDSRVRATARVLGLEPLSRKPAQLSGGQQERPRSRARSSSAPISCLLDEPLANLDDKLREELPRDRGASLRPRAQSSSTPPPSRSRRCCSAPIPRRSATGAVTQFGPTA